VYGPQGTLNKKMFIRELKNLKQRISHPWLILGDFNLIHNDEDKNNNRLNRSLMVRFKKALDYLEVKEIPLIGMKFTWSNGQDPPTLSRIDRAFCSLGWEQLFLDPILQATSSSISDHCPRILHPPPPPTL
jgi:endonuclease/exonuclease/phosphatase family metal-dependent hydrolase